MNFRNCIIKDPNSDTLARQVNTQLYNIVREIDPASHTISKSVGANSIRHVSFEDALAELLILQTQNKTKAT